MSQSCTLATALRKNTPHSPRVPELKSHHQVQFIVIPRTPFFFWSDGLIPLQGDTVVVFLSLSTGPSVERLKKQTHLCNFIWRHFSLSDGVLEYIDFFSAEGWDPSPTSVLDMTLNNLMVGSSDAGVLGNAESPLLPLLPGPLWPGVVVPDMGPIYGLKRTKLCFFHYTDFCI